jgi:hypothetical protein
MGRRAALEADGAVHHQEATPHREAILLSKATDLQEEDRQVAHMTTMTDSSIHNTMSRYSIKVNRVARHPVRTVSLRNLLQTKVLNNSS